MKILIIRTAPNKVKFNLYNLQEIGLAKALIRRGHSCDVMYYTDEKDYAQELEFDSRHKLNILWMRGFGAFYEGVYPSLCKIAKDYDILHISEYLGFTSCWLNRKYKDKCINYHGPYYCVENKGDIMKARVLDTLLLPFSRKSNMIVATKSVLATDYIQSKGISDVTTVGVGLDISCFLNEIEGISEQEFIKGLLKKGENEKYLLYIGAIEERRNTLFLLDLIKKIRSSLPRTKLVLVGSGKADYTDLCKRRIEELGISSSVMWCDYLEQKYLKAVYEISDVFLLPTRYEIFGMVLLEAMFFGLPTFTTYNGGSATLINKDNGYIFNNLDIDIWSREIISVLKSSERYHEISRNATKLIKEEYTWDALAEKFENLYLKRILIK